MSCHSEKKEATQLSPAEVDSVSICLNQASDKTLSIRQRKTNLLEAYNYNQKIISDSLKNKNLLKIALQAYNLNDSVLFRKMNDKAYQSSLKIEDTYGIADTHWSYGNFFRKKEVMDSAYYHYYKAQEAFNIINNEYYSGKMLYNMAVIQANIKDYTGSEILTFNAIAKFKPLKKNLNLYRSYNHLGVIYSELEEYDKSIFYYNEALDYLKRVADKGTFREGTLNNIGLVYDNLSNYDKAIEYFGMALSNDSLKIKNKALYARLLDNLAYNRFLKGDTNGLEDDFNRALKIRDSLNNISGIIINKLHLAEFYAKHNDTVKAITFAKSSNDLAKSINNNRDNLASLKLLSEIDKINSSMYLKAYIILRDSLQKEERKIRDKFTRIRFETDEYVEETERLSQQRIWITVISLISIIVLSLLYFLKQQRSKNKELIFEAKQQSYNEEIYKLMLKQQASIKRGQLEERNRISEELHDGVLSKLFGTRLGMGFLNLKGDENTLEKHKSFIDELQQVEKEIRVISHELKNDLFTTELGFINLVENLLEKQSAIGGYTYIINSDSNIRWDDIDEKVKIHLYRIIQEGLSNIAKYSKAKKVKINFKILDKILTLTVEDDGVGFDMAKNKKGIGLLNMYSRTQKLSGEFVVDSRAGNGTKLTVSINI